MNFLPILLGELININVIFLLYDVLNTTEHEDVVVEN